MPILGAFMGINGRLVLIRVDTMRIVVRIVVILVDVLGILAIGMGILALPL
jgi:hypothetical protein